jgi:uncharacterized protein YndB with AHSA1/START domain
MQQLQFNITINAPREKVWNILWGKDSYPKWASAFSENSTAVTDWKKGSKAFFTDGSNSGMVSRISESIPNEYLEITHEGMLVDGKEDYSPAATQGWAGAKETYTLKDNNGQTELLIQTDITDEYLDMFNTAWPKALDAVKQLSEN